MHDIVVAFAKWCEATPWGVMTRESIWAYPVVQLTHFTGLSLWLGTNFALDLRLLGIGNREATPAQVAQDLFIWNWIGFAIVLTGGFHALLGNRHRVYRKHCLSVEAGHVRSLGAALAHFRAAQGARLGTND